MHVVRLKERERRKQNMISTEKINKTKGQFFKKISKIDKLLARLTKKNRERGYKLPIFDIQTGAITDPMEKDIKRILYKTLCPEI